MNQFRVVNLIILVSEMCTFSLGLYKHWLPNQEWNSEENWVEGHVPELDSEIIFPLEMKHVVGLPIEGDLQLSKIELPVNGALVLAEKGLLQISDTLKNNEKTGIWSREGQLSWADPLNWNSTSEAVPHIERLPCQIDYVVLPGKDRVFKMLLPMKNVKIKGIFLANETTKIEIGISEWYHRVRGREFSETVPTVSYSQLYSCERCMCQEGSQSEYLEEICDIQRPRCGYSPCQYPLKVEGHCCHYCGARLSLPKNVYAPAVNRIAKDALGYYGSTISWHVRTTWKGGLEILIVEKGQYSGIRSQEASTTLQSYLREESIEVLWTENSGGAIQDNRLTGFLGALFGGLLFTVAMLLIIFPYYGYSYAQVFRGSREIWTSIRNGVRSDSSKGKSYAFARFENLPESDVQLTGNIHPEYEVNEEEPSSSGGRFENPLYSSRREFKRESKLENLKIIDFNSPVSLAALKNEIEDDDLDDVEIAIEGISETEQ